MSRCLGGGCFSAERTGRLDMSWWIERGREIRHGSICCTRLEGCGPLLPAVSLHSSSSYAVITPAIGKMLTVIRGYSASCVCSGSNVGSRLRSICRYLQEQRRRSINGSLLRKSQQQAKVFAGREEELASDGLCPAQALLLPGKQTGSKMEPRLNQLRGSPTGWRARRTAQVSSLSARVGVVGYEGF
jgi:hypothetical protein